jgi:hypothetical protein
MDSTREDSGIVGRVRERATSQLATQKDRATDGLGTVAQAMRQTTQHLRTQQQEAIAGYAEKAADQLERFSQRLKEKDVTQILDDAQQLARRQPALFIGGAFAIGLLGARFLKSSSPRQGSRSLSVYRDDDGFSGGAYSTSRSTVRETSASPTPNAYGHTVPTERF